MLSVQDFLIQRKSLPVLDVRSEGEFAKGHVPGAINIPILNDAERKIVGTLYKQQGPKEAIKEGIKLVGPRLHDIIEQAERVSAGQEVLVHCWRGGMRSNNFCWLVSRLGVNAKPLQGGYKAYRGEVLKSFENDFNFLVVSGSTGSGKTEILQALKRQGEQIICLETLANHKGSAFGGLGLSAQPSTEQFENNLYEEIIKLDLDKRIWIEDESIAIGKIFLPQPLWKQLRSSPLVKVNVPVEVRVKRLVADYGDVSTTDLLEATQKITTKLGGQHFKAAKESLLQNDLSTTASILLTYYDKAYDKAILNRQDQIVAQLDFDWQNLDGFIKDKLCSIS
ncbi:tRNA 2-selenouridine(34) synthase MnmH [Chryseotalea sanaruensis]|uniref:tRNA 2-selenouridine(34) synthase MnmH n=1 Tax=Chryseotalea sanaruensis TaxID=2482724 RepID=A0A401UBZ6_9BACT|nr:tRNA 2-selenouridine(34) synthase MnmH [Chryseotalea sanaruensis]GCC52409.1 tRNA 2-selenouridine(34) synthase MnmH [Chryseotalea sanaruensis]